MSKKLAVVIAHFDPDGHVPLDLLNLISALKKRSNEIIFVSTNINKNSALIIEKMCNLITRENFGYDFWSYKVGIESILNKKSLDSILLINSSVIYFNSEKLLNIFFKESPDCPAIYGLTESFEIEHHVQSFWVEFCSNELINSKAFELWWDEMIPISEQFEVIKKYEIGMSKYFRGLGINLEVLYKRTLQNQVLAACRAISDDYCNFKLNENTFKSEIFNLPLNLGYALNPTHILWDDILEKYDWIKVRTLDRTNKDFRVYKFIKYLEGNIENLENSLKILLSRRLDGILSK